MLWRPRLRDVVLLSFRYAFALGVGLLFGTLLLIAISALTPVSWWSSMLSGGLGTLGGRALLGWPGWIWSR